VNAGALTGAGVVVLPPGVAVAQLRALALAAAEKISKQQQRRPLKQPVQQHSHQAVAVGRGGVSRRYFVGHVDKLRM
jgi:hypothetical protein